MDEMTVAQSDSEKRVPVVVTIGSFRGVDLPQRQISIMQRIEPFFTPSVIREILVPLVNQESGISLRALDWLVTNYSKKLNIVCKTRSGSLFNIYHGYKIALTHFRRRNFDPFRRRRRIDVMIDEQVACESTIGQCNFLHWSYVNGVLAYAIENAKDIEIDMNSASAMNKAERRMQKANGVPHRRRELSSAPRSKCSVYQIETNVTFDCMAGSDSEHEADGE